MASQTYAECILRFSDILNTVVHRLHSIKYTTSLVLQSTVAFTRNCAPVVSLLNTVPVLIWAHALQCGCFQGLLALNVSLCCFNSTLTNRYFRLGGRRYATRGHFGSASLKRGDISMTHWWSWRMRVRWGRSGWKVTTSRVSCSFSLCTRGVNSSSRDILVALSIPCCTFSPSWPLFIK